MSCFQNFRHLQALGRRGWGKECFRLENAFESYFWQKCTSRLIWINGIAPSTIFSFVQVWFFRRGLVLMMFLPAEVTDTTVFLTLPSSEIKEKNINNILIYKMLKSILLYLKSYKKNRNLSDIKIIWWLIVHLIDELEEPQEAILKSIFTMN